MTLRDSAKARCERERLREIAQRDIMLSIDVSLQDSAEDGFGEP